MSQGHMLSKKTLVPGSEASLDVVDQGSSGDFKHNTSKMQLFQQTGLRLGRFGRGIIL